MEKPAISKALVDYALQTDFDKIPKDVIDVQKKALVDALAVSLGATTRGEGCDIYMDLARQYESVGEATVIGAGFKAPVLEAALANGSLAHAIDFEDVHDRSTMHSNAVPTAALLTVADYLGGISGREFLAAMVVASDTVIRLQLALKADAQGNGWYTPPVNGALGASLGVGKLFKLDAGQMMDCLTLAQNQAIVSAELVNSSVSILRSVRDSFCTKAAVLAGLLAKKGLKARFDTPLEGRYGFYTAVGRGEYDPEAILEGLGTYFHNGDVSFKPWSACRGTHPYIDMMTQLVREHGIRPEEITAVHVVVSPLNEMLFNPAEAKYRPTSAINAKFSIPYTSAVAAYYGTVGLEHFTPEMMQDERLLSLAAKFTYEVDRTLPKDRSLHGEMRIDTARGSFEASTDYPKGNKKNPMSTEEFRSKFVSCARYARRGYSDAWAQELFDTIMRVDELEDMREITRLL